VAAIPPRRGRKNSYEAYSPGCADYDENRRA